MAPRIRHTDQLRTLLHLAGQGLRMWTPRQVAAAVLSAAAVAVVIGIATVLIPNPVFARDIEPVWWNYPIWILTAGLTGMLIATYVRPHRAAPAAQAAGDASSQKRSSRFGAAGTVLAWFAVGCPVCNKIALLALGYSGAITWFAPIQPYLAGAAVILCAVALVVRLKGQVLCAAPRQSPAAAAGRMGA
ncbi:MAG: hypothetical protein ACTMHH_06670 [Nesterenkonia sp.]